MSRTLYLTDARDLAAAIRGVRPDALALGIAITPDWCRDQMHTYGETRYENVSQEIFDRIADDVDLIDCD